MITYFLCEDCMKVIEDGGLRLKGNPKSMVRFLLTSDKDKCQITLQDNGYGKIRIVPVPNRLTADGGKPTEG